MKHFKHHKSIIALVAIFTFVLLTSCTKTKPPQPEQTTQDLTIHIPDSCITGTITVYAEGIETLNYFGTIEIVNDGRDGQHIKIIAYADRTGDDAVEQE